jgi:hypothetical protein
VLERLGMRKEAHFVENEFVKGEWQTELIYAMVEGEWRARRCPAAPGRAARRETRARQGRP